MLKKLFYDIDFDIIITVEKQAKDLTLRHFLCALCSREGGKFSFTCKLRNFLKCGG